MAQGSCSCFDLIAFGSFPPILYERPLLKDERGSGNGLGTACPKVSGSVAKAIVPVSFGVTYVPPKRQVLKKQVPVEVRVPRYREEEFVIRYEIQSRALPLLNCFRDCPLAVSWTKSSIARAVKRGELDRSGRCERCGAHARPGPAQASLEPDVVVPIFGVRQVCDGEDVKIVWVEKEEVVVTPSSFIINDLGKSLQQDVVDVDVKLGATQDSRSQSERKSVCVEGIEPFNCCPRINEEEKVKEVAERALRSCSSKSVVLSCDNGPRDYSLPRSCGSTCLNFDGVPDYMKGEVEEIYCLSGGIKAQERIEQICEEQTALEPSWIFSVLQRIRDQGRRARADLCRLAQASKLFFQNKRCARHQRRKCREVSTFKDVDDDEPSSVRDDENVVLSISQKLQLWTFSKRRDESKVQVSKWPTCKTGRTRNKKSVIPMSVPQEHLWEEIRCPVVVLDEVPKKRRVVSKNFFNYVIRRMRWVSGVSRIKQVLRNLLRKFKQLCVVTARGASHLHVHHQMNNLCGGVEKVDITGLRGAKAADNPLGLDLVPRFRSGFFLSDSRVPKREQLSEDVIEELTRSIRSVCVVESAFVGRRPNALQGGEIEPFFVLPANAHVRRRGSSCVTFTALKEESALSCSTPLTYTLYNANSGFLSVGRHDQLQVIAFPPGYKQPKEGYCYKTLLMALSLNVPQSSIARYMDDVAKLIDGLGPFPVFWNLQEAIQLLAMQYPMLLESRIPDIIVFHDQSLVHVVGGSDVNTGLGHLIRASFLHEFLQVLDIDSGIACYRVGARPSAVMNTARDQMFHPMVGYLTDTLRSVSAEFGLTKEEAEHFVRCEKYTWSCRECLRIKGQLWKTYKQKKMCTLLTLARREVQLDLASLTSGPCCVNKLVLGAPRSEELISIYGAPHLRHVVGEYVTHKTAVRMMISWLGSSYSHLRQVVLAKEGRTLRALVRSILEDALALDTEMNAILACEVVQDVIVEPKVPAWVAWMSVQLSNVFERVYHSLGMCGLSCLACVCTFIAPSNVFVMVLVRYMTFQRWTTMLYMMSFFFHLCVNTNRFWLWGCCQLRKIKPRRVSVVETSLAWGLSLLAKSNMVCVYINTIFGIPIFFLCAFVFLISYSKKKLNERKGKDEVSRDEIELECHRQLNVTQDQVVRYMQQLVAVVSIFLFAITPEFGGLFNKKMSDLHVLLSKLKGENVRWVSSHARMPGFWEGVEHVHKQMQGAVCEIVEVDDEVVGYEEFVLHHLEGESSRVPEPKTRLNVQTTYADFKKLMKYDSNDAPISVVTEESMQTPMFILTPETRVENVSRVVTWMQAAKSSRSSVLVGGTGVGKSTFFVHDLYKHLYSMYSDNTNRVVQIIVAQPTVAAAWNQQQRLSTLFDRPVYCRANSTSVGTWHDVAIYTHAALAVKMLNDLESVMGVTLVILDEFHQLSAELLLIEHLLTNSEAFVGKILFVSATPRSGERLSLRSPYERTITHSRPINDTAFVEEQKCGSMFDFALENKSVGVFLSSRRRIEEMTRKLKDKGLHAVAVHGGTLTEGLVQFATFPPGEPKYLVTNNTLEAGVTVDLTDIVDFGVTMRPHLSVDGVALTLAHEQINRIEADQRAGRVGRLRPGRVVRFHDGVPVSMVLNEALEVRFHLLAFAMRVKMNFRERVDMLPYASFNALQVSTALSFNLHPLVVLPFISLDGAMYVHILHQFAPWLQDTISVPSTNVQTWNEDFSYWRRLQDFVDVTDEYVGVLVPAYDYRIPNHVYLNVYKILLTMKPPTSNALGAAIRQSSLILGCADPMQQALSLRVLDDFIDKYVGAIDALESQLENVKTCRWFALTSFIKGSETISRVLTSRRYTLKVLRTARERLMNVVHLQVNDPTLERDVNMFLISLLRGVTDLNGPELFELYDRVKAECEGNPKQYKGITKRVWDSVAMVLIGLVCAGVFVVLLVRHVLSTLKPLVCSKLGANAVSREESSHGVRVGRPRLVKVPSFEQGRGVKSRKHDDLKRSFKDEETGIGFVKRDKKKMSLNSDERSRLKRRQNVANAFVLKEQKPFVDFYGGFIDGDIKSAAFYKRGWADPFLVTEAPRRDIKRLSSAFERWRDEHVPMKDLTVKAVSWADEMTEEDLGDVVVVLDFNDGRREEVDLQPHRPFQTGTSTGRQAGMMSHAGEYRQVGASRTLQVRANVVSEMTSKDGKFTYFTHPSNLIHEPHKCEFEPQCSNHCLVSTRVHKSFLKGCESLMEESVVHKQLAGGPQGLSLFENVGRVSRDQRGESLVMSCVYYNGWIIVPAHLMTLDDPLYFNFKTAHFMYFRPRVLPRSFKDLMFIPWPSAEPRPRSRFRPCMATTDVSQVVLLHASNTSPNDPFNFSTQGYLTWLDSVSGCYNIRTHVGWCGAPVLKINTNEIVGIHTSGLVFGGTNGCVLFSQDDVKILNVGPNNQESRDLYAEWGFNFDLINYDIDKMRVAYEGLNLPLARLPVTGEGRRYELEGSGFQHMGLLVNTVLDSSEYIGMNPLFEEFCDQEKIKARYPWAQECRDAYMPSALNKIAGFRDSNKYNRVLNFCADIEVLEKAIELVMVMLEPVIVDGGRRTTEYDVLMSLDMTTAAGACYGAQKCDVLAHLTDDECLDLVGKSATHLTELTSTPGVWKASLKDELRPVEKVLANKTRVFTAAPLEFIVGAKVFTDAFNNAFYANHLRIPSTVGLTKFYGGWQRLFWSIADVSDCVWGSGDGHAFDSSLHPLLVSAVYRMRTAAFRRTGDTIAVGAINRILQEIIFTPISLMTNTVCFKKQGNNSGQNSTIVDNTIALIIAMTYGYLRMMPAEHQNLSDMNVLFKFVCNGDDNLYRRKKLLTTRFGWTMESFAEKLGELGLNYEFGTEGGYFDVEYMSLCFQPIQVMSTKQLFMTFRMDRNRLFSILQWIRYDDPSRWLESAYAAMREAAMDHDFISFARDFVLFIRDRYDATMYVDIIHPETLIEVPSLYKRLADVEPTTGDLHDLLFGDWARLQVRKSLHDFWFDKACEVDDVHLQMESGKSPQRGGGASSSGNIGSVVQSVLGSGASGLPTIVGEILPKSETVAAMVKWRPASRQLMNVPRIGGKVVINAAQLQGRLFAGEQDNGIAGDDQVNQWRQLVMRRSEPPMANVDDFNQLLPDFLLYLAINGSGNVQPKGAVFKTVFGGAADAQIVEIPIEPWIQASNGQMRRIARYFSAFTSSLLSWRLNTSTGDPVRTKWAIKHGLTDPMFYPYAFDYYVPRGDEGRQVLNGLAQAKRAAIRASSSNVMSHDFGAGANRFAAANVERQTEAGDWASYND